jgi:hypothetical protein
MMAFAPAEYLVAVAAHCPSHPAKPIPDKIVGTTSLADASEVNLIAFYPR